jgi:3-dehydroquinate synthase class II
MNSFLLHRGSEVRAESVDGHKINRRIESRIKQVGNVQEVVEGLCFRFEVDEDVNIAGTDGIISGDRPEERNISYSVRLKLRKELRQYLQYLISIHILRISWRTTSVNRLGFPWTPDSETPQEG